MAKFKFHLESLLKVREQKEENKKNELGKAFQALEQEKKELEQLNELEKDLYAKMQEELQHCIHVKELKHRAYYSTFLNQQKRLQQENIHKADQNVDIKRKELLQAVKEKKMVEILKEKALEAFKKELLDAEQKAMDELVSSKFKKYSSV